MDAMMMDYPLTLKVITDRIQRLFADVEIVTRRPDRSLRRGTWGEAMKRAHQLAEALQRAGLNKGDRVATFCWNHQQHLEAYYGAPLSGGVVHTLNLRLHADDVAYIANHAKDRFVIVDDVLWPLFDKFRARVPFEKIIVVSHTGKPVPEGTIDYEEFLATATGDFTPPAFAESDALGMCYTSGTTGQPKGVVYSHRSTVLHSFSLGIEGPGVKLGDTILAVVPMFHANAWGLPMGCGMFGAKLVLPGPFLDPPSVLDLMEKERVTMAAGVPTIWLGIVETLDKDPAKYKLRPGTRMLVGGSAAPESLIRAMDRHGLTLIHAWGMTETSPLGSVAYVDPSMDDWTPDQKYALRAKQGRPAPMVEIRAVDDAGREVPWDGKTFGELHVRGAWIASGYYNAPETAAGGAAPRWARDGWFMTGDVVTIDRGGMIEITDRSKDVIKSGGEWISSVALENALMGHPAVKEAAVIAVAHPKWAERPLACVVVKEGQQVTPAELDAFLSTKFAKFWLPEAYDFIEAVPRTSVGKFQKTALRARYRDYAWPAK